MVLRHLSRTPNAQSTTPRTSVATAATVIIQTGCHQHRVLRVPRGDPVHVPGRIATHPLPVELFDGFGLRHNVDCLCHALPSS